MENLEKEIKEYVKEFDIEKINSEPGEGETSVYYANYNSDKKIEEVTFENVPTSIYCVARITVRENCCNNMEYYQGRDSAFSYDKMVRIEQSALLCHRTVL